MVFANADIKKITPQRDWLQLIGMLVAFAMASGCLGETYRLPDPPQSPSTTPADRTSPDHTKSESEEKADADTFIDAKKSLLKLYKYLSQKRYDRAKTYLSQQTLAFLSHEQEGRAPTEVLAEGRLLLPNGEKVAFDPVEFFLTENVRNIRDSVEGIDEHETGSRKELFLIDESGNKSQVVMIREGGRWVLHKTALETQ